MVPQLRMANLRTAIGWVGCLILTFRWVRLHSCILLPPRVEATGGIRRTPLWKVGSVVLTVVKAGVGPLALLIRF